MKGKNKVALIYDLDDTLVTKIIAEFSLFPNIIKKDWKEFEVELNKFRKTNKFEAGLAYLYYFLKVAKQKGIKITKELLNQSGGSAEYFPGVQTWFDRINNYGLQKGIIVEHYMISAGIKEIIDGASIAKNFKKIFSGEFHYNENGEAEWPKCVINYTNKTQYIHRINRGMLDYYGNFDMNKAIEVPFENMLYIGDGLTDIPCMKMIMEQGGEAVAVYNNEKSLDNVQNIVLSKCASNYYRADYSEGSELDWAIKKFIRRVQRRDIIFNGNCKDDYDRSL